MAISIDAVVGQRAIDAARERGEADIPGVTSLEGTPVDKVLGLDDFLRDIMSFRTHQAGAGLLGQGASGLRQISMMGNEAGDTIHLGMKMGESYDDFLDRTLGVEDKEKVTLANLVSDEALKALEIDKPDRDKVRSLVVEDVYDKILPETPAGTTDIFNAETGMWESVYDKLDRPSETSFVDTQVTDIRDDILSGTQSFEVETPSGTTDIFDTETGEWTALTKTKDEKTEEERINSLINQLSKPKVKEGQAWRTSAEDELQKAIALEEETTVLDLEEEEEDESVFQKVIAETLGLPVDTVNAVISSILRAAGAPDKVVENPVGGRAWLMANKGMTIDDVVAQVADMLSPTTAVQSAVSQFTPGISLTDSWPSIPTVQDTQTNVMDEGILAGLGMTAEESQARTRALNTLRVGGRKPYPWEIEARKQGAIVNPLTSRYATSRQLLEEEEQETSDLYNTGYLEGLSQAMKNVLENDPELLAQYMAARSNIIAQLDKTGYKEHEEFYPGSRAAATQAGFWGPMALGWNDKYNEYKDAQRELMGLQSGQRFMSDDWINNLGWMSPEQINRISGYGAP